MCESIVKNVQLPVSDIITDKGSTVTCFAGDSSKSKSKVYTLVHAYGNVQVCTQV
jgi:hypothetical protein